MYGGVRRFCFCRPLAARCRWLPTCMRLSYTRRCPVVACVLNSHGEGGAGGAGGNGAWHRGPGARFCWPANPPTQKPTSTARPPLFLGRRSPKPKPGNRPKGGVRRTTSRRTASNDPTDLMVVFVCGRTRDPRSFISNGFV
jgi:hypothetical protein